MGATTGIAWTRSTRNFWSGCTKIGPGCDGCYAEASSRRMRGLDELTREAANWGPGRPRVSHLKNADEDIRKWDRLCNLERGGGIWRKVKGQKEKVLVRCFTEGWSRPGFWPVFINSYSDTFDNEVPQLWRQLLFTTIEDCEHLTFQLVTKRIGNVEDMLEGRWSEGRMPKNVWLIITVVNQEELDRDGPKLLELTERLCFPVVGLSIEPQLGEIDARRFLERANEMEQTVWGIGGGESAQPGHPARPFVLGWGKRLARDFRAFNQPFFFKQAGSNAMNREGERHPGITGKGDDPTQWPEELRVQEFPA
jgi:protein gp37